MDSYTELFDFFPCLCMIQTPYGHTTSNIDRTENFTYVMDDILLAHVDIFHNLISALLTRGLYIDCKYGLSCLSTFISKNNIVTNKGWLGRINDITINNIDVRDLQTANFICDKILRRVLDAEIYLRFAPHAKKKVYQIYDFCNYLLRNASDFRITKMCFHFCRFSVRNFIGLMQTHQRVFLENNILQTVELIINESTTRYNNDIPGIIEDIPDIVKKCYDFKLVDGIYLFTKKKQ